MFAVNYVSVYIFLFCLVINYILILTLLEYLNLVLIVRSWFLHCNSGLKLNSSKPLKGSPKFINPSTHQFSVDSAVQFVWEDW